MKTVIVGRLSLEKFMLNMNKDPNIITECKLRQNRGSFYWDSLLINKTIVYFKYTESVVNDSKNDKRNWFSASYSVSGVSDYINTLLSSKIVSQPRLLTVKICIFNFFCCYWLRFFCTSAHLQYYNPSWNQYSNVYCIYISKEKRKNPKDFLNL